MNIKKIHGYELEKAQANTSEDFFNRSEVTYFENGVEKTFHLLYLRYFDEIFTEFVPFESEPLFHNGEQAIFFKDIIGLICLLSKPELINQKRVYINSKKELAELCESIDYEKLPDIVAAINKNGYEIKA
ncbi:hypothetical protein [Calidifontibacillus oryziterrae]|uniref:hypothetical protein n=1 Tax=Calidifontibacillus oryziterrae TaxID=1191699 RepID=UPI00030AA890|nr:hypothetical protein [Calidifontibacillus oryziterrae]